jgi:four helix bundle protein
MILDLAEQLPNTKAGNHLGGQIIRSGTAPALNYGEAQRAESRADFHHKMKISLKELQETLICVTIIERRQMIPNRELVAVAKKENTELVAIFTTSITTAQAKK